MKVISVVLNFEKTKGIWAKNRRTSNENTVEKNQLKYLYLSIKGSVSIRSFKVI